MRPLRVLHVTAVEAGNYYLNNLVDFGNRNAVEYVCSTLAPECPFVEELRRLGKTVGQRPHLVQLPHFLFEAPVEPDKVRKILRLD